MAAKTFNKPVYVAAESYKFARFYPLTQADLPERRSEQLPLHPCVKDKDPAWQRPALVEMENPSCDYTPSQYISLIFTDLGILTPAAVSDELIRLYGES
jgi:translation initiation factor eIF-2B subunit alpha